VGDLGDRVLKAERQTEMRHGAVPKGAAPFAFLGEVV